jgi:inorganic pyrophosphatase
MIDKGEDDKIIAVCADDMSVNHIHSMDELPPHFLHEMKHFFLRYKELEQKSDVVIDEFYNRDKAIEIIKESIMKYQKEIVPTL